MFYFQETVTRRFPAGAILHVATGSLVLRLAAYAALPALPSPWFVLPVELMQGLTFALSWGTCCVHCKRIAPESLQATMQVRALVPAGLGPGCCPGVGNGHFVLRPECAAWSFTVLPRMWQEPR